jgi:hypothetical protein
MTFNELWRRDLARKGSPMHPGDTPEDAELCRPLGAISDRHSHNIGPNQSARRKEKLFLHNGVHTDLVDNDETRAVSGCYQNSGRPAHSQTVKPSIPIQANNDVAILVVPMERADTPEMART